MATMKIKLNQQEQMAFAMSVAEASKNAIVEDSLLSDLSLGGYDMGGHDCIKFTENFFMNKSGLMIKLNEKERAFLYLDGGLLRVMHWGFIELNTGNFLEFAIAHYPPTLLASVTSTLQSAYKN